MTTYNTGNPVGSSDPRDLYDNAENLDVLALSKEKTAHDDRLGKSRKTWHGIEQAFQEFLLESGYQDIGDYAAGLEITARNQIFLREGEYYRAGPSLDLPYTTTGDWTTEGESVVSVGDGALRQELAAGVAVTLSSTGQQSIARALDQRTIRVSSTSDMKGLNITSLKDGQRVAVLSYHPPVFPSTEFLGGGEFYWDSASTAADDGGVVFAPDPAVAGRWLRVLPGYVTPLMFGAKKDGASDDAPAFQGAVDYVASKVTGGRVHAPAGKYSLGSSVIWDNVGSFVSLTGDGSNQTQLEWTAAVNGFFAGDANPVGKVAISGMSLIQSAEAVGCAAIRLTTDGSTPLSVQLYDVTAYGGSVGGTPANGYWGNGAVYLINPTYCHLEEVYHFGIGGADSANSELISSGFTIIANDPGSSTFFTNMKNCFGNGSNYGVYFSTQSNPGIEGVFMDSCNFNSCNTGIRAEAPAGAYHPPQYVFDKCQIEFLKFGLSVENIAKLVISDSLFFADPTADIADTAIYINNTYGVHVNNCTIEARPVHTKMYGVYLAGDSKNAVVHNNSLDTPNVGIVFDNAVSNSRQNANDQLGSGDLLVDVSSNAATNLGKTTLANPGETYSEDGVNEKWGSVIITTTTGGAFTYNFSTQFKNTCLTAIACNGDNSAGTESCNLTSYNQSGINGVFAGAPSGVARKVNFFAKGY